MNIQPMQDEGELGVALAHGVCTITLSRPARKNAFTNAMYARLADTLESLDDMDCRCVLLRAEGDVFCAGNDLNDFLALERLEDAPVLRVLTALAASDVPIVAAVGGAAVGIGTTILLHCDLVYASAEARFAAPFVALGLVPEAASSRLLPELLGYRRAMAMFLLGEFLDVQDALAAGLVSHLGTRESLDADARAAAERIVALPVGAVRATRRLCRMEPASLKATIARENEAFAERLHALETRQAIEAALQALQSKTQA